MRLECDNCGTEIKVNFSERIREKLQASIVCFDSDHEIDVELEDA